MEPENVINIGKYMKYLSPMSLSDTDDAEGLATVYNCSHQKSMEAQHQVDFAESVFAFTPSTWLVTIAITFLLCLVIRFHCTMNKVGKVSESWIIFTNIVSQPVAIDINFITRIISLIINTFVFFVVICYLKGGIKSDKVTKYQPNIYDTYQDIVSKGANVDVIFPYRRHKRIKMIEKYKNETNGRINIQFTPKIQYYEPKILLKYLENDRILIGRRLTIEMSKSLWCEYQNRYGKKYFLPMGTKICIHMSYDASLFEGYQTYVWMSNKFPKRKIYQEYLKYLKRSIDTGLMNRQILMAYGYKNILTPDTIDCMGNDIVLYDPEPAQFGIYNYKYALLSLLIPTMCALFSLFHEKFRYNRLKRTRVIKQRNIIRIKRSK